MSKATIVFFVVGFQSRRDKLVAQLKVAVKTAVELNRCELVCIHKHPKSGLPGIEKNQVCRYGVLRVTDGYLWCTHGLRTGYQKPGFWWFYGLWMCFERVFTVYGRVSYGFLRCSYGLWPGSCFSDPQNQSKSVQMCSKLIWNIPCFDKRKLKFRIFDLEKLVFIEKPGINCSDPFGN